MIKDISAGGAFIEFSRPFPIGQEITLVFSSLGDQKPVRIIGEIAWTGPQGIGVKFKTPGLYRLDNLPS
jgi:Tfp pilus assembly protein PilZ